jgi:hypothetical protein
MEALREHTQVWERIAPDGSFDTRACKYFIELMGGPSISAGKQCIAYLTENLAQILEALNNSRVPQVVPQSPPMVEEVLEMEEASSNQVVIEPPIHEPLVDQCETTLEAEALERLSSCVNACFKTDRGIILLENDLLLYRDVEESYRDTWFSETCEMWKDRLHSSLGEEFCTSLGLWMVSRQSK